MTNMSGSDNIAKAVDHFKTSFTGEGCVTNTEFLGAIETCIREPYNVQLMILPTEYELMQIVKSRSGLDGLTGVSSRTFGIELKLI